MTKKKKIRHRYLQLKSMHCTQMNSDCKVRMQWKVDSKMIENEVNEDHDEVFDSYGVQRNLNF